MFIKLYTIPTGEHTLDGFPIFDSVIRFMNQTRNKQSKETITKIDNKFSNVKFNLFPSNYRLGSTHGLVFVTELNGYVKVYLNFKSMLSLLNSVNFSNGEYNGDVSLIQINNDFNYTLTEYNSLEYLNYSKLYFSSYDINGKKISHNGNKLVSAIEPAVVYVDPYKTHYEYIGKFKSVDVKRIHRKYTGYYGNRNYFNEVGKDLTNDEVFHVYAHKTNHSFEYICLKTPKRLVKTNEDPFFTETVLLQYLKFNESYRSKGNTHFTPSISFPGLHYMNDYMPCYYIDFSKNEIRMYTNTDIHPHMV
jgi:hypothetical protein